MAEGTTAPASADQLTEEGEGDMGKKAAAKAAGTVEAKPEKKLREKKVPLKIKAPKGVEVKETKYVATATKDDKRMWMRGSSVGLTHKVTGVKGFKPVTEEEAKKNHLGKTRMIGKIATQDELNELIEKYFA